GGAVRVKPLGPAALVFQFSGERFRSLGLVFGIQQREFSSLDDGIVRSVGGLEHAQDMLCLFPYPLVAADGGDPEDVKLFRLQEDQDGLLIAGARATGVLVDDYFVFLGRSGGNEENNQQRQKLNPTYETHNRPPQTQHNSIV